MTGNNVLLDISAVIDLFKGNAEILKLLSVTQNIYVSSIVIGELYYGVQRAANIEKHTAQVEDFVSLCKVLSVTLGTSKFYATIKNELRKKGKPIPENDIWIAATAIESNLHLITLDKHFSEIDNLKLLA